LRSPSRAHWNLVRSKFTYDARVTALRVDLAVPAQLLVLIGGGEFSFGATREVDEFLLRSMPADRRTVAFIPAASGSAEYAGHFGKYLQGIDATVETVNVPIYRGRDSRRQKNLTQLLSAGMIYLGGGVTNNLLAVLRESAADLAMREAAANGTVIAAIGAAASCFGIAARDMHGIAASLPGLGWVANTVIDTAFDPDNDANLRRLMSVPETLLGIGIPAGTALAIRADGATEIAGGGNVAAFRKAQAR
jgi:cyanophycinase-like exopeptidase